MKKMMKTILGKAGYAIRDKQSLIPKDLRGIVHNPLVAKYFARQHYFLILADFKNCIAINRFSCEKTGHNPLVNTVTDYLAADKESIHYSGSKLEHFFNTFTPKNVAEMFNLKGKLHEDLVQLPAAFFVHPWENADMESKGKFRVKYLKAESARRELSLNDAYGNIGPISEEFGNSKIKMLDTLTKSISEEGYLRGNKPGEDITATILVDGSDYKYLITDGTHRIAVLSALDYKSAPIRVHSKVIPAFIYRNEVEFWPNVRSGLYNRDQALQIFDSIFEANDYYLEKTWTALSSL